MKRTSTLMARGLACLMALAALAVLWILMPELAREEAAGHVGAAPATYPFFIGAYVLAVPYFAALFYVWKFLGCIDRGQAFSDRAVAALRGVKLCAAAYGALMVAVTAIIAVWARRLDPAADITAFFTLGFIFTFAALVIASFVAVLQRLLQGAVALKAENDLIV